MDRVIYELSSVTMTLKEMQNTKLGHTHIEQLFIRSQSRRFSSAFFFQTTFLQFFEQVSYCYNVIRNLSFKQNNIHQISYTYL